MIWQSKTTMEWIWIVERRPENLGGFFFPQGFFLFGECLYFIFAFKIRAAIVMCTVR